MTGWLLAGVALAGGFTHRETRDPLPAREVARDLVLPKGWSTVTVSHGFTRWEGLSSLRPFPGETVWRRASEAGARVSVGDRVELRGAVRWVDVRTGAQLGGGLGPAEVGAAWSLARGVAPARSLALDLTWTVPDGHPSLPLGSASHRWMPRLLGRWKNGGLRLTGSVGGLVTPPGEVPWLVDAADRRQRLDLADGAVAEAEALLQAGFLGVRGTATVAWLGPDRIDGQVVSAGAPAGVLRGGGFAQLDRAVQLGAEVHASPLTTTSWLAPLPRLADGGRGVRAWVELAL